MNNSNSELLIFIRNARIGQVKTRLAATLGDDKALQIYIKLLEHTATICKTLPVKKSVFYSEFIEEVDEFEIPLFNKYLQLGSDLGDKMKNAFVKSFANGKQHVVIIGSDCYELSTELLLQAFDALEHNDVVIGPAKDGGYYLLGMKRLHLSFFVNKSWSTNNVFLDTLLDIQSLKLSYHLLPELNDVDVEADVPQQLLNDNE